MNEFEKQLREKLNSESPPALDRSHWLKINDEWSAGRKIKRKRNWAKYAVAASLVFLLSAGLFWSLVSENEEQEVLAQYGLEAHNFPKQVAQKIAALQGSKIPKRHTANFEILRSQLLFLDQQYEHYLNYIEKNGYQEFIGKQIQNYYEVKIELLEKIQNEIEKLKFKSNEKYMESQEVEWNI